MSARQSTLRAFNEKFGGAPSLFRAPGRVNLIGEHTDYNDGFVMPAALEMSTWVAIRKAPGRRVSAHALLVNETVTFDLDEADPKRRGQWADYVRGVAVMLERAGHRLGGAEMTIGSDVPLGAGLSSSAALEVAVGAAMLGVSGRNLDLTQLALIAQQAENEFIGMRCGIMDQFISCHGKAGHALMLDCRSLDYRLAPMNPSAKLVICNSMVHHAHAGGEYNLRRKDCELGVEELSKVIDGVRALRDVTPAQLERHRNVLPETTYRRCRHIVTENERVLRSLAALNAGDLKLFGRLMNQSHASMRDDFEITCKELDILADLAWKTPGVLGSRMTGGGFGGCTVSLVEAEAVERFIADVPRAYEAATGIKPDIFIGSPGDGAGQVAL